MARKKGLTISDNTMEAAIAIAHVAVSNNIIKSGAIKPKTIVIQGRELSVFK